MVDEIITRQELIDAKRDAHDLGKAVNEKVIVSPRYGEDFKSLPMIAAEFQISSDAAEAAATAAAKSANIAQSSANIAEVAATAATISAGVFETPEAGVDPVTGVADGAYFNVRSSNDESYVDEYQNIGGAPTPSGKSYPSAAYVQNVAKHTALPFVDDKTYSINERVQLANGDIVKSTVANNTVNPNIDLSTWIFDKECYYASDFAKPNTQEPQGVALQYGYAKATLEGKCFVIDDVFWVSATESNSGSPNGDRCAINVLSNSDLLFAGKGCLKVIPSNSSNYNVIIAHSGVKDYRIISPNIIGDRYSHDYSSGGSHEWGHGLCIYESSDGLIINPKIADTTGDGIYIGMAWNTQSTDVPKNITVLDPLIKNARRNGIAFTSGDNVNIVRPVIIGTIGTAPEAGIDIEPEGSDTINFPPYIKNSRISSPTLIDNKKAIETAIFGDLHVDLVFDGTTTIINDTSPIQISGVTMSTRPYIQSDPMPSQTGSITFDHVFFKRSPTAPTYFAPIFTDFTSTGFPIVFNQVSCDIGSTPSYGIGAYENPLLKKRSGVEILNFNMVGDYKFGLYSSGSTVFGQKIHLPENMEVNVNDWYSTLLEFTNDSYIGGFSRLSGHNGILSKYLTNNVVFDQNTGDSEYYRIVNMSGDTREHNFSILNANLATSHGLQLLGINYLGKTSALSNEPAPFINITNNPNTQIKNYSHGWDFRVYRYSVPSTVVPANGSVVVDIPITYFEKNVVFGKPQYTYWFETNVNQNLFVRFEKSSSGGRLVIANTAATPVNFDSNILYVNII